MPEIRGKPGFHPKDSLPNLASEGRISHCWQFPCVESGSAAAAHAAAVAAGHAAAAAIYDAIHAASEYCSGRKHPISGMLLDLIIFLAY